jgi:thiol-disulfide isomerase/thioredoxin
MKTALNSVLALLVLALLPVSMIAQDAQKGTSGSDAGNKTTMAPDVAALLAKASAAYHKIHSYRHSEIMTITVSSGLPPETINIRWNYTFAMAQTNMFSLQSNDVQIGPIPVDTAFSDGKTFFTYRPQTGKYIMSPSPSTLQGIDFEAILPGQEFCTSMITGMFRDDLLKNKVWSDRLAPARVGLETLEGSKRYETLVLEGKEDNGVSQTTFYFDSASHLLHQVITNGNGKQDGKPITVKFAVILSDIKINPTLPDSLFQFHPPASAKEVATFSDEKEIIARYEGKAAADFAAKDRNGKLVSLLSLKGKVVILDFWASWCGPCKEILPYLQEISDNFTDQGVVVLAVDTFDSRIDCDAFLKTHPQYTMNVLMDPAAMDQKQSIATRLYGVHGIPTTIIIDKEGVVQTYAIGSHEREFYLDALKQLGVSISKK